MNIKTATLNKMLFSAVRANHFQDVANLITKGADINAIEAIETQYLFAGGVILTKNEPLFWDLATDESILFAVDQKGLINEVRSIEMLELLLSSGLIIKEHIFGKSYLNYFNYFNNNGNLNALKTLKKFGFQGIQTINGSSLLEIVGLNEEYLNYIKTEYSIGLNHTDDLGRNIAFKLKDLSLIPLLKDLHLNVKMLDANKQNAFDYFENREFFVIIKNNNVERIAKDEYIAQMKVLK